MKFKNKMTEEKLKTLKVEEMFINYKVFSYLWLVNTLRKVKENVLFVEKNTNQPIVEAKPVHKNVESEGKQNMIRNILNNIQKFQEKHLKIGNGTTEKELIKERGNDGELIKNYESGITQMNSSERKGLINMGNVSYVVFWGTEKPTISNIQGRILS